MNCPKCKESHGNAYFITQHVVAILLALMNKFTIIKSTADE